MFQRLVQSQQQAGTFHHAAVYQVHLESNRLCVSELNAVRLKNAALERDFIKAQKVVVRFLRLSDEDVS